VDLEVASHRLNVASSPTYTSISSKKVETKHKIFAKAISKHQTDGIHYGIQLKTTFSYDVNTYAN
jgi:hypothetical protein